MEKELIDQKQLVLEEDEIDLIDLLKTIYKNRKLIIGIAGL
jgi:LPS O-antigen subunit length determinant protein (WzzB/FepE family)